MFRRDYASADQSDDLDSLARYDVCCCNEHIFLPFDLLYDRLTFLSPALYLHFSKANNTALTNEADRKIRIEQLKGFFAMHVDKGYLEKMASTAEEVKEAIVEEQFDEEAQARIFWIMMKISKNSYLNPQLNPSRSSKSRMSLRCWNGYSTKIPTPMNS